MKPDAYQRNLAARAFDVARYLLFWGVPTNVGQVTSIRTLEKQIRRLKASEYAELRSLGDEIAQACAAAAGLRLGRRTRRPSRSPPRWRATPMPTSTPRNRAKISKLWAAQNLPARAGGEGDRVDLVRPTNVPADIAATLLYPVTTRPFRELYELACSWSERQRAEVIDVALRSRTRRDEILGGFRGGLYAYDIVMDIGAYRDLHRHRRCQKFRQAYCGNLGFDTPQLVTESGAGEIYASAMQAAFATMHRLPAPGRRIPAAVRRALALPVQDGFRRSRVHLAPAQRREGPLQLPRNRLGDEGQDGAARAGAGAPDRGDAAVGRRPVEAVAKRAVPQLAGDHNSAVIRRVDL